MRRILIAGAAMVALAACQTTGADSAPDAAQLDVAFAGGGWDGERIPQGQQCSKFGGDGKTPPLRVANVPAAADMIVVEFNDRDYQPMSYDGGHGKIGFPVKGEGGTVTLPSVPGETADLPGSARVGEKNRATGDYARPGYLPPCSGGRGNDYFAVVKALDTDADPQMVVGLGRIELGRY